MDPPEPPRAAGQQALLIKPATYDALRERAMQGIDPDPADFEVDRTRKRVYFRLRNRVVQATVNGAFYTLITDSTGDVFLQGGTVNGEPVSTSSLQLFEADPDPGEWLYTTDGEHLYISVAGDGIVEDGVLLPGFTITGITISTGTPPGHTLPTVADPGVCIVSLGQFLESRFYQSGLGDINISFCPGQFTITRTAPLLSA